MNEELSIFAIARSALFLFMLLNPFLMVIYMLDVIKEFDRKAFLKILVQAAFLSITVFSIFAWTGEAIFTNVMQAHFESLQIFGGIVFLLIGLQFVFTGKTALVQLRGKAEGVFGAIAMPLMIGPGTISASVMIGNRHNALTSFLAITIAVLSSIIILTVLKKTHDYVRPRNEPLIEKYIEIAGRVAALVVGTFSIEMIMSGLSTWFKFGNQ